MRKQPERENYLLVPVGCSWSPCTWPVACNRSTSKPTRWLDRIPKDNLWKTFLGKYMIMVEPSFRANWGDEWEGEDLHVGKMLLSDCLKN